jgi:hypothetical protein
MKWLKKFEAYNNCPNLELTDEIIRYVNSFDTDEELLRSGGLPNEMIDRLAYGFSENDIKTISPSKLHIKWKDDLENVKWEQEKSGLSKKLWASRINLSEPIDISFTNNKFYIEDGHHRYWAAKILNKELKVNLEIKDNPIKKLTDLGYDNFHRCIFMQVKNNI